MATIKFTLKLWISKKANRVIFAETSKDFVDFLLSLLSLPLGSVVKLLTNSKLAGCISSLYDSVENLNNSCFLESNKSKQLVLNPKSVVPTCLDVPCVTTDDVMSSRTYYSCNSSSHKDSIYFSSEPYVPCPHRPYCYPSKTMATTGIYYAPSKNKSAAISTGQNGYVKEAMLYMVMDDLSVMPLSTVAITTLFSKSNVEDINLLQERVVDFGKEEALELLKLSMHFKTALSEVFLVKKEKK